MASRARKAFCVFVVQIVLVYIKDANTGQLSTSSPETLDSSGHDPNYSEEDIMFQQGRGRGKSVRKRPAADGMQINPQNIRHPQTEKQAGRPHHREVPLLPNMFSPIQFPAHMYHGHPYNPYLPFPYPLPAFNSGIPYEDTASSRSAVHRGTLGIPLPGPFNLPPQTGIRGRDPTRMSPGREGIYGDRLGMWNRPREVVSEDDDEEEIISGKFRPCGGECAKEEFLCVGSCTCLPIEYRCDGKADCTGFQDELECGEATLDADLPCLEKDDDYRCPRSGKCIKKMWLCDGDDDCGDFSDETHCDGKNCTDSEFECANGLCIDKGWLCDGDNDCKDNSDEMNCTKRTVCTDDEFKCGEGGCISNLWKCDGDPDCLDASDEDVNICPEEPRVCDETEFECTYPRCIRGEFRCDGDDDCGDWSDEENCEKPQSSCGNHEFTCPNGRCISDRWVCDQEPDCEDSSDEKNCSENKQRTCFPDEFVCDNGNCIPKFWMCDNIQDCIHGEDEKNCVQKCEDWLFDCQAHGRNVSTIPKTRPHLNCVQMKHVCDGKRDCPYGEDETNCPTHRKCDPGSKCEQGCVVYPNGTPACSCRAGFSLAQDGFNCKDVDECLFETEPVCSHRCINNFGSFECSCLKGYVLRPDGRTCKAVGDPPTLLFANRVDIRQLSLSNRKYTAIMKGLENAIALDYHHREKLIFWSDVSKDVIKSARLNGTEKTVVIKWGLETPGGVAIDWIHNLLFWTDAGTRRVEVATIEGKHRYVIAAHDLDKPRAIAAHPGKGIVFWTDWGPHPKIERADMDGGNRTSIVKESVAWPNGLTIDYPMERIYWADAKHHVIESSMFDGSDRKKVITKGLPHPFALTLFEDALFWTDWHTKSIATASKDTGVGYKVLHAGLHFPMDIHSFHSQRQPNYTNHCGQHYGGCTHLCLPTELAYRCVCPLGLELQRDGKSCDHPSRMLIFARKKDIRLQQMEAKAAATPSIDMVVPLDGIMSANALSVHADEHMIYWTDLEGGTISRSRINGSEQQLLVAVNIYAPTGLALDWLGKKLYWCDRAAKRIEVSNLDGSMRSLLIWEGLKAPNDVTLNPVAGHLYWTDWDLNESSKARIFMAGMDGSNRKKLRVRTLDNPRGLVLDHETSRLFWTDGGHIMYSHLDGSEQKALAVDGAKLVSPQMVAIHGSQVYWTDIDAKAIYTADKMSGKNAQLVKSGVSGLTGIVVLHSNRPNIMSPCAKNNGGCSHLCLISPTPAAYVCSCNTGIKLLPDKRTCADRPTNSLIFAHRVDIRQISLDVPYMTDTVLPLPPMKSTVGVDVDLKTGVIYWTDTTEDVISRSSPDGDFIENIVVDSLREAGGIAIDSTGRKIYWTDDARNSLEVAELDGSNRKVLFSSGMDKPRAIALHYHNGLIFWSDWGENPSIERAGMDGQQRRTIIKSNLAWPNGLAIDRPQARLYWNDGKLKVIESSKLDGSDRRTIIRGIPHPYGLVIVGSHVYWTDWQTEGIHRADKYTGADSQMIVSNVTGPMDIRSVQVENIAENACGENNGGCSHLCLRSTSGYTCDCPTGILIQPDQKTCANTPNAFLMFTLRRSLARVSLDTPDHWEVALPIPDIHMVIAIDFHWAKRLIFYTDVHLHIIKSVNMDNESDTATVIGTDISSADGLAVDWLADNIYWTDTGKRVVAVARLDGSSRKVIINDDLDEPRAITVFPRKGYLFWTDWGESPKIERSAMDGSSRKVIVPTDLGFPNGLTIDYNTRKLYWADALRDRIEMCDLNGKTRMQLVPHANHPFGLAVYGNHVYWTDWFSKKIERADKTTGLDNVTIRADLDGVMEIRAVAATKQTGSSPCQINNGECSHLCLLKERAYLCECPDVPDKRPCRKELRPLSEKLSKQDEDETSTVGDVGAGFRSDLDVKHGFDFDSSIEQEISTKEQSLSPGVVVIVSTVAGLLIVIVTCAILLFIVSRRRKETHMYPGSSARNVLAFSNPNYNSNTDNNCDKKFWKKLKYDRSTERVYGVQDERPEGLSLITDKSSSPPPTPPKRFDSINIAIA